MIKDLHPQILLCDRRQYSADLLTFICYLQLSRLPLSMRDLRATHYAECFPNFPLASSLGGVPKLSILIGIDGACNR